MIKDLREITNKEFPDIGDYLHAGMYLTREDPYLPSYLKQENYYYRGPNCTIIPFNDPLGLWLPLSCAIALVAGSNVARGGPGTTSAVDTSGATLLVASTCGQNLPPVPTDSKSTTWSQLPGQASSFAGAGAISCAINPTVGAGHTFTIGGTASAGCFAAFSGVDTSDPFDQAIGANGQGSPASPGAGTPSENNSLIVTGLVSYADTGNYTVNGGFTRTDQVVSVGGVYFGTALAYLVQTSAASSNPAWSFSSGDAGVYQGFFKAAAAANVLRMLPILGVGQ